MGFPLSYIPLWGRVLLVFSEPASSFLPSQSYHGIRRHFGRSGSLQLRHLRFVWGRFLQLDDAKHAADECHCRLWPPVVRCVVIGPVKILLVIFHLPCSFFGCKLSNLHFGGRFACSPIDRAYRSITWRAVMIYRVVLLHIWLTLFRHWQNAHCDILAAPPAWNESCRDEKRFRVQFVKLSSNAWRYPLGRWTMFNARRIQVGGGEYWKCESVQSRLNIFSSNECNGHCWKGSFNRFNKAEKDFPTLLEYNNYLEEVEDISEYHSYPFKMKVWLDLTHSGQHNSIQHRQRRAQCRRSQG